MNIKRFRVVFCLIIILSCNSFARSVLWNGQVADPLLVVCIMVKDEALVMRKTLLPFLEAGIDSYLIFDTGSDDDTIKVTRDLFEEFHVSRGYIEEEPFIDFSTSRNHALDRVESLFPQACFILMPDAEWYMHGVPELLEFCERVKDNFWHRTYLVRLLNWKDDFYQSRLIRAHSYARFEGVVHEYINVLTDEKVPSPTYFEVGSSRNGIEKSRKRWQRDLKLLQGEYEKNPEDRRSIFYLGQTYDCLGDQENAYHFYKIRAQMTGWPEETFMAQYRAAQSAESLYGEGKMSSGQVIDEYLEAYLYRPCRAEPLIRLARFYLNQDKHALAQLFSRKAYEITYPVNDYLFVDKPLYEWDRYEILSRASWYTGDWDIGEAAARQLLENFPQADQQYYKNLALYLNRKQKA